MLTKIHRPPQKQLHTAGATSTVLEAEDLTNGERRALKVGVLFERAFKKKKGGFFFFFGGGARRAAAAAGGEALSSKLPTTTSAFFGASHGTLSAPPARRPAFDSCLWHPAESRADSIEPCEETEEYKKARTCAPRALSSSP